jgi:DNA-directed RNA polymerase sigma subunit (sigma70/sigma32)
MKKFCRFDFVSAKSDHAVDITNRGDALSEEDENPEEMAELPRLGEPSLNNLAISRPALALLSADKEDSLILAAQAGDTKAARELVLAQLPWVRTVAYERWLALNPPEQLNPERAVALDDFVAAGVLALWRQIDRWKPGFRLNTYARSAIKGAMAETSRDWRIATGFKMESDIQRFIRAHPDWSAERIAEKFPNCAFATLSVSKMSPIKY